MLKNVTLLYSNYLQTFHFQTLNRAMTNLRKHMTKRHIQTFLICQNERNMQLFSNFPESTKRILVSEIVFFY